MKFYEGYKETVVGSLDYLLEVSKENHLYADFLKLAAYYEVTKKFGDVKDGLKLLSRRGQDDALAYYLFNADELDEDMRRQATFLERYSDKTRPEELKVIAGLHLHDKVNFNNETKTVKEFINTIDRIENFVSLAKTSATSMMFFYDTIESEEARLKDMYLTLNKTQYADCLRKAQLAYFDAYNKSKNPLYSGEYLNLRFYSPASNKITYPDSKDKQKNLETYLLKELNRYLKYSEEDKKYCLHLAYAYCSLVCKDNSKIAIHSKSVLKSISKLPLKTENLTIGNSNTKK